MTGGVERRAHARIAPEGIACGALGRLRSRDAIVRNVSEGGALIETAVRIVPGGRVSLEVETVRGARVLSAVVMRSMVCAVGARGVRYRAAVRFEEHFLLSGKDHGSG